jgi:thiamine-phosphate pyrophosphorylase
VHGAAHRRQLIAEARLYAITADDEPHRLEAAVRASLKGGAQIVQLRHKSLRRGALLALARKLQPSVAAADALFIVNDHLDIALAASADGVHLGGDDLSIAAARRVAGPELLIGASASSESTAREAEKQGADYVGSGPAFSTPIKAEKRVIGPAAVAAIARSVQIPVFAIGGVDESNIEELVHNGVHRACVIRALFATPDPEVAARKLRSVLNGAS